MNNISNTYSLDRLAAALASVISVDPPEKSAAADDRLLKFADENFPEGKADRIVMYNPDAVAQWIYEKYAFLTDDVKKRCGIELPFQTVMPSVTPVCFGTMYTGAQPAVHGIQRYEKPVIHIDCLFDSLIRAGKKCAIICDRSCSMGKIFLERAMDYFYFDSIPEINAFAAKMILEDRYDFLAVYNGNYDSVMHRYGPESLEALAELKANAEAFSELYELIRENWQNHNTLLGFAMDHGCHEIDGGCGSHGLDMPEDINIVHLYSALKAKED